MSPLSAVTYTREQNTNRLLLWWYLNLFKGTSWSPYCQKNNFIRRSISSNKIVNKFKYDMSLNFLNLAICILCTKKILVTNESWSKSQTFKSKTLWFILLTHFCRGHQMDCATTWRSETTFRDVVEKITSPLQWLHIATVLKSEPKIAAKDKNN